MIILIHSSKTMRKITGSSQDNLGKPELQKQANELSDYLKTLTSTQIAKVMAISPALADKTNILLAEWNTRPNRQGYAVDVFLGDIYSGLQVDSWTEQDREYANSHLRILSGLYGILLPLDGICPYRLEMGYKLPNTKYSNLYSYWGQSIAKTLPVNELVINLSAVEYSKVITDYIDKERVIAPNFLTISPKTSKPTFVAVHTKIARGAYASWLIRNRINSKSDLCDFSEIGYKYDKTLSTTSAPVFVCQKFNGKGLSIRLK